MNNIKIIEITRSFTQFILMSLLTLWLPATGSNSEKISHKDKNRLPDYAKVFNQKEIVRINISIKRNYWEQMQNELDSTFVSPSHMPLKAPHDTQTPPRSPKQDEENAGNHPFGNLPAPPMHGPGNPDNEPDWHECTVKHNGKEWQHVGIRCKGNSSLRSAHQSESKKYSFKLNFDKFEDDYSETKNQRFYGFKQLNLNNNFKDASLLREKVAADLFRDFGLIASNTAFCLLYIDFGDGLEFKGIYTLVEEVDDTVIKTQFSKGKGNLYKPEGPAATFAAGSFDTMQMNLKTNKKNADFKDVEALYKVINSKLRITDTENWKNKLEGIFDVNNFLKWLAVTRVIQNWDSYGQSARNYYLYNNPQNGLLTWIPWDNNEALFYPHNNRPFRVGETENDKRWPLISYLLEQTEYKQQYDEYVLMFSKNLFSVQRMHNIYNRYYTLLKPYVKLEVDKSLSIKNENHFDSAIEYLKEHVSIRTQAVALYLQNDTENL